MKLAYLDECGTEQDEVLVIAGIVIDVHRLQSVRRQWVKTLKDVSKFCGQPIKEFHMRDVYGAQREWGRSDPFDRACAVESVLKVLSDKSVSIVFSAALKSAWESKVSSSCPMAQGIGNRWLCGAFHVALSINKAHKGMKSNKGNSILIFDKGARYERQLPDLLVSPPSWSDTYYSRTKREQQLEEIIDTSFFADSTHAPLIQLADIVAYIRKRFASINDAHGKDGEERFLGEIERLEDWIEIMKPRIQPSAHRYKKVGRCDAAEFFWSIAPPSLRSIA